jgi:hypothetical protein
LRPATLTISTIGPPSEQRMYVPWRPGRYLPLKWKIEVDSPRHPLVELEVDSIPEPRCVAVRIKTRSHDFNEHIDLGTRLPLATWFNHGLRAAGRPAAWYQRTEFRAGPDPLLQEAYDTGLGKRGPKGISTDHLKMVAAIARDNPRSPNRAVQDAVETSRGTKPARRTVQYWLSECRARDLL